MQYRQATRFVEHFVGQDDLNRSRTEVEHDYAADATKFDALVQGVDRKVEVLQRVAERRVHQATAARSRRTSAILSFLTALTIVTVTVALITNFLGSRSDRLGHLDLRILIVAVVLIASVGLYRGAYRERPRRRRKGGPPQH